MSGLSASEFDEDNIFHSMEDTLGPYYPPAFLKDFTADPMAARSGSPALAGEAIELSGMICDLDGEPVCAALLETWQADGQGPASSFTRQYVTNGRYVVRTFWPEVAIAGATPDTARARQITMTLFCDGIARLVTQIFFDGDPRNTVDPLLSSIPENLRPRLIAKRLPNSDIARYALDIVLRGDFETPFFDDGMNGISQ